MAPTLIVDQPVDNLVVQPNQPFLVAGRASERVKPEPILIDSVMVQVDGEAPVDATLTHIPDKTSMAYTYRAFAEVTPGSGSAHRRGDGNE